MCGSNVTNNTVVRTSSSAAVKPDTCWQMLRTVYVCGGVCACTGVCSYLKVIQRAGQAETFGASKGASG